MSRTSSPAHGILFHEKNAQLPLDIGGWLLDAGVPTSRVSTGDELMSIALCTSHASAACTLRILLPGSDRRAGYFFGKDRRGVLDRVPLMTLSIGVVTNAQRAFKEAPQISRLATEMKSYAKTLTGSVYSVDRRTDERPPVYDARHPSINDPAGDS